jgi:hypothetical protein
LKKKKIGGFKKRNMKNKIIGITLFLLLTMAGIAFAQRPQSFDKDKLEAARVAFITNRLDLKPDQAEKFWPLFNQFNESRGQLMGQISTINKSSEGESNETKAKEMIKERMMLQQKLLDLEKEFMDNITKVIQPSQALRLGGVNREFTKQVYRMQQNRGSN